MVLAKAVKTNRKRKSKHAQIIGQGTYGCVFRPEINCRTQLPGSDEYLSKISVEDQISQTEIGIGKVIQTFPNYRFFFAPILEYCDINISTIDQRQVEKCEVFEKSMKSAQTLGKLPKFISSKIHYVGNQNFSEYFAKLLIKSCSHQSPNNCFKSTSKNTKHITQFLSKIVDVHLYLLHSIKLLGDNGIVHLDLKFNNFIYDKENDVFIIIDFGLARLVKDMEAANYEQNIKTKFGVLIETYPPWAIDIVILSFIAKYVHKTISKSSGVDSVKFNAKIDDSHITILKRHCTLYATKNPVLQLQLFTETDRKMVETQLHKWVDTFKGKTWKDAWTSIWSSNKTWDNYSLAVMYLHEFQDTGIMDIILRPITNMKQIDHQDTNPKQSNVWTTISSAIVGATSEQRKDFHFLIEYVSILKNIILAEPTARKTPDVTSNEIKTIFQKLDRAVFEEVVKQFNAKILTPKNIETIKANKLRRNLEDLKTERDMYEMVAK